MVHEILQELYPTVEVNQVLKNGEYDFEIFEANDENWDFTLLYTDGLAKHEQLTDPKFEAFKHIELYFCLPHYWDLKTDAWPIYWLDRLAAVPQKNQTWFGPGDTIPAGYPPEILTERFPANHFMLSEPIKLDFLLDAQEFKEKEVSFLGIIPILQVELDYKLRNSATVLIHRLKNKNYSEQVDLFRESVCRKRFLNFI